LATTGTTVGEVVATVAANKKVFPIEEHLHIRLHGPGGVTPIDTIVTAAAVHLDPVDSGRGGVAMHSSVSVHVVNGQKLEFNV